MPSLSLYFAEDFADPLWKDITYQLDAPSPTNERGEWVLGRSPDTDLTIQIKNISRRHAAIAYSYAADRWTLEDLGSSRGTYLRGATLRPTNPETIRIGDRFYLAANLVSVVEDAQDTTGDDLGPPTVASTEPIIFSAPAPAPAPAQPRTYADTAYFMAQWLFSGESLEGKVYRLLVIVGLSFFFVLIVDWVRQ